MKRITREEVVREIHQAAERAQQLGSDPAGSTQVLGLSKELEHRQRFEVFFLEACKVRRDDDKERDARLEEYYQAVKEGGRLSDYLKTLT